MKTTQAVHLSLRVRRLHARLGLEQQLAHGKMALRQVRARCISSGVCKTRQSGVQANKQQTTHPAKLPVESVNKHAQREQSPHSRHIRSSGGDVQRGLNTKGL